MQTLRYLKKRIATPELEKCEELIGATATSNQRWSNQTTPKVKPLEEPQRVVSAGEGPQGRSCCLIYRPR
jgi:hypothetical protein